MVSLFSGQERNLILSLLCLHYQILKAPNIRKPFETLAAHLIIMFHTKVILERPVSFLSELYLQTI